MAIQSDLANPPAEIDYSKPYAAEYASLSTFKKAVLLVLGAAAKKQMDGKINLKEEQEILMNIADMINDVFCAESMLLRVHVLTDKGNNHLNDKVYIAALKTYFTDVSSRILKNGSDASMSFADSDLLKGMISGLRRYSKYEPYNVKEGRRIVAKAVLENDGYCFK